MEWIDLLGEARVRNVSIPLWFWAQLGNNDEKVSVAFSPEKWDDPEAEKPVRKTIHLRGLRMALTIYRFGQQKDVRKLLRAALVKELEVKHDWFKQLVLSLG